MQECRSCAKHRVVPAGDHQEQGGPALPQTAAGKAGTGKFNSILESQDSCTGSRTGQKKHTDFGTCSWCLCPYRSFSSILCGLVQERLSLSIGSFPKSLAENGNGIKQVIVVSGKHSSNKQDHLLFFFSKWKVEVHRSS